MNKPLNNQARAYRDGIIKYYSESGMDYEPWSSQLNMHFGYYRFWLSPFNRERMLDEMSYQVATRLQLDSDAHNSLIDLGCGVGASARYLCKVFTCVDILGATIVPWQIEQARQLTDQKEYANRIRFELLDYRALGIAENSVDGAYAMESSCYDYGKDKRQFLQESYRVLKPGARLCVADGFTKGRQHSRFFRYLYNKVCQGWALEDFAGVDEFVAAMRDIGYEDIEVEDVSWRIALSVSFVPWVSFKYFFKTVLFGKGNKRTQLGHFIAPVFGLLMGLHRRQYGYHLISARKPKS